MSLYQMFAHQDRMRLLKKQRHSADERGAKKCQRCGLCCWIRPCALTQADLAALAQHHNLGPKDFFARYCAVDTRADNELSVILLRANEQHQGGRYLTTQQTWSLDAPCIFLREEKGVCSCAAQDVKPEEGRACKCWLRADKAMSTRWTKAELMALGWDGHTDDEPADDYDDDAHDDCAEERA